MGNSIKKADPIFDYYQRELDTVYERAEEFAKKYPKVASALALGKGGARDPQIERLLEGFAFICAKMQKDIDDEFSRVPEVLLSALYPYLIRPIPSSTILRMDISGAKGSIAAGVELQRGEKFFFENHDGIKVTFSNAYDTKLFALDVQAVEVKKAEELSADLLGVGFDPSDRFLRINFKNNLGDVDFSLLDKFNLYLHGSKTAKRILHEIFTLCDLSFIEPLGFSSAQAMIPIEGENHPAYRLLLEYFNYSDKFFFFSVDIAKALGDGDYKDSRLILKGGINEKSDEFDLLIPIANSIKLQGENFDQSNILTNCIPVINLYQTTSEPISWDHKRSSYPLYVDSSLVGGASIYLVENVYSTDGIAPAPQKLKPFFGFNHFDDKGKGENIFWSVRYKDAGQGVNHQGASLSLHGFDYEGKVDNNTKTVYADLLVSNANAAEEIPVASEFSAQTMVPADKIYNITAPTSFKPGVVDGESLWKLVSHLSINHMSLSNDDDALPLLKEVMKIYERNTKGMRQQEIDGIKELKTSLVTMHVGRDAWRGFVNGMKITMRFDDDFVKNGNALLFASVMNKFFALLVSSNSFSKLEIFKENESYRWYTWQPVMGSQDLL